MSCNVAPRSDLEPPAAGPQRRNASPLFVRKLGGIAAPSQASQPAWESMAQASAGVPGTSIASPAKVAKPRWRAAQATRARARPAERGAAGREALPRSTRTP